MNCYQDEYLKQQLLNELRKEVFNLILNNQSSIKGVGGLCEAPNTATILIQQLKREVDKLSKEFTTTYNAQNRKIGEAYVYLKENLNNSIRSLFDDMKITGELAEVITDVAFASLLDKIEKTSVYYDEITTEKLFDDTAKCTYYVTKIPAVDSNGLPIRLRMGVAHDATSNPTELESNLAFAQRKNASVCINAGIYDVDTKEPYGTTIKDGVILFSGMPTEDKYQFLGIKADGSVKVYSRTTTPEYMLADGAVDVTCIFGSLILDGVGVVQTDLRKEPRQSIGFDKEGNIIIISCDGRTSRDTGLSYDDLVRLHYANGSYNAYILDGGGSTSTVVKGVKQNENIDSLKVDRAVSTFLYVTKENYVSPENNAFNEIGKVKQEMLTRFVELGNVFDLGYIQLKHSGYQPGIELYVNNEASRRSKIGLSFDPNNNRNTYLYWSLQGPTDTSQQSNLFRIYPQGTWVKLYSGTSSERPNGVHGLCYFDTTLGKPIWYNSTKWVDATGTAV